jgi:hypothetical protein
MKIYLRQSGGFANIQLEGQIDTADLPDELARRTEDLLALDKIPAESGTDVTRSADSRQFYILVSTEDDSRQFEVDESTAEPELSQLCNDLINEIIKRKKDEENT